MGRLNQWFDDTPMPSAMQYDNDIRFKNKIVQGWCECHAVTWVFQLPYRPQSNGVVKRWNGPLKQDLRQNLYPGNGPKSYLRPFDA